VTYLIQDEKKTFFCTNVLRNTTKVCSRYTNSTAKDRQQYIDKAKQFKFKVIGYYFECTVGEAITRNKNRKGKEVVPDAGIGGTFKKFQIPSFEEGFDELYKVRIVNHEFVAEVMANQKVVL
jgi:predicted kinase